MLYYSTTLLVAPGRELMEELLRHPPREPEYRRGRTHREFVGAIADHSAFRTAAELQEELGGIMEPGDLERWSHAYRQAAPATMSSTWLTA